MTIPTIARRFLPALLVVSTVALCGLSPALTPALSPAPDDDLLAAGVAEWVDRGITTADFHTGNDGFDAEWVFGTWQMAALGFGQHALAHPEARAADLAHMERCIDGMLGATGRAFDTGVWHEDPLTDLASGRGHVAWLGYTDLVLSLHRQLEPASRFAAQNDAITEALARRIASDPIGVPETYPGERYPVDTAAAIGAIGLHDRVTGTDHAALLATWTAALHTRYTDPANGLLYQALGADGTPHAARGSGTFLGAYFLSFADPGVAASLYRAGRDALFTDVAGVGAMREYPVGHDGSGDIDSGPIVGGLGLSATGFALAMAHATGDDATFAALARTTGLFGGAADRGGARHWVSGRTFGGGPIADAILFAMFTAGPT